MKTEKEQLVGFVIFIMQELGMDKYLPEDSHSVWLGHPISGIRQVANDMLEATQDISIKELAKLDAKLDCLNLPTLTSMRQKSYKKLLHILSRNHVKNESEWRVLRFFSESNILNTSESSKTQELLNEFELKLKGT